MAYGQNAGKSGVVYILREMDNHHKLGKRKTHLFKIGESTRSGKIRAEELTEEAREKGSNVSYEFITESRTQDCYGSEQLVFKRLEEFRLGSFGEWGGHELFEFIDDHQLQNAIKVIRETCVEVDSKLNQELLKTELTVKTELVASQYVPPTQNENLRRIIEELEVQRPDYTIQKRPVQEKEVEKKTGFFHSIIRITIGTIGGMIGGVILFIIGLFVLIFLIDVYETTVSNPSASYQPPSAPATYVQPTPAAIQPYKPLATDFKSYPINTVYNGKIAQVILNTADKKRYRTRLRAAATMPADFSGEYVFVRWECGMRCIDGAVVSHKTGHVVFLPANVCCWFGEEDLLQFQLDSSLLIANGSLNEGVEYGKFFYEFNGREFKLIHTQLLDREEAISKSNEQDVQSAPTYVPPSKPVQAAYVQPAPVSQQSIIAQSAAIAQASQDKLTAFRAYRNSPEAAADYHAALVASADSSLEKGVHDAKSSFKQLFNLATGDSKAVAEQAEADKLYHLANPSE